MGYFERLDYEQHDRMVRDETERAYDEERDAVLEADGAELSAMVNDADAWDKIDALLQAACNLAHGKSPLELRVGDVTRAWTAIERTLIVNRVIARRK